MKNIDELFDLLWKQRDNSKYSRERWIEMELKDEWTHPRLRLSLEKRYKLSMERIQQNTDLMENEKQELTKEYTKIYESLSKP
ncbi:hypothetical protein [Mangrovibacillus cuniculi]|uniref:Uncharacterized protein n=1 Tax=Mangrovibacillus cuniculi TaxID=2593652 RepID=A0A7S8CB45_9BACI|nr:hypothetical protein [Mangrovibacillus cuniculi]QPC46601.1 hypothetical protein G8O30_06305 [Mangrovibacillus cuniculi]